MKIYNSNKKYVAKEMQNYSKINSRHETPIKLCFSGSDDDVTSTAESTKYHY